MLSRVSVFAVLAFALSTPSYAAPTNVFTIDLTRGLRDVQFNLLSDGNPGDPTGGGADIILPNYPGVTMVVGFGGARDERNKYRKACEVRAMMNRGNATVIRV